MAGRTSISGRTTIVRELLISRSMIFILLEIHKLLTKVHMGADACSFKK